MADSLRIRRDAQGHAASHLGRVKRLFLVFCDHLWPLEARAQVQQGPMETGGDAALKDFVLPY
jgi:hypothetical protein